MDELFGQSCKQCGKIEVNWLDNGQSGYRGILKVDYRDKGSVCAQRCIGPSTDMSLGYADQASGRSCPNTRAGGASGSALRATF